MAVIIASTQNRNKYIDKRNERDVMNGFIKSLIDLGQPSGKTNYLCNFNDMNFGINIAKKYPNEIFVSNHSNAHKGNSTGTIIFYHYKSEKGYKLALSLKAILKSYLPNRSISIKPDNQVYATGFYELRATPQPALLIEWFFHDNLKDVEWWNENREKCLKAICKFIGLKLPDSSNTIYRVQVGAFKDKSNAQRLLKELKSKGFDGIIK